jgi:FkbM family methyltransferase
LLGRSEAEIRISKPHERVARIKYFVDRLLVFLIRKQVRGGMRLWKYLCRSQRLHVSTKHGVRLLLDPGEGIDSVVLREGFYEEEVYLAVEGALSPDDVFWDIGANLGLHAFTVRKNFPSVGVYAFEPNPAMVDLLKQNAKRNDLAIEILPIAVGNTEGESEFFLHQGNSGRCGLYNRDADPKLTSISVQTASGDALIARGVVRAPSVIKIDVEGHEFIVLQGLAVALKSESLRAVVFEDQIADETEVKELLRQSGFEIRPLHRMEATHHNLENYLAFRPVLGPVTK